MLSGSFWVKFPMDNMEAKNIYPLSGVLEYKYNCKPDVAFIVNYFAKPNLIVQMINNARKISDNMEIIVNNDSKNHIDIFLGVLNHRNDRLIISDDLGEYMGYNQCAKLSTSTYLIFNQDDDVPPADNHWWQEVMQCFQQDTQLALITFFKGGDNYPEGTGIVCNGHRGLVYFLWCANGPFIVKRDAFLEVGMFDSNYFHVGEAGGGADADLCTKLWLHGYHCALLDSPETIKFQRRVGGATGRRNGDKSILKINMSKRILLNNSIYKKNFTGKPLETVLHLINQLNQVNH